MPADITCQTCPGSSSRPHVNRLALPQLIRATKHLAHVDSTFKKPQILQKTLSARLIDLLAEV